MKMAIYVGYDPREEDALKVCLSSIAAHLSVKAEIRVLRLEALVNQGLYKRPIGRRGNSLWDIISDAPMSTEFAISRFFIPQICMADVAVFMDVDMLVRTDMAALFDLFDPTMALQVVKHDHKPGETKKMDGQTQTSYFRKNWSSVVMWNVGHDAHRRLTLQRLNEMPGRWLHSFGWLRDEQIGALPKEWNHLVSVDPPNPEAKIAHFTLGIPSMAGWENQEFADEWRGELAAI